MQSDDLGFLHRFVPGPAAGAGPTLLLLHGTGGNEHDLLDLGRALAPQAALLSPRGKVLEHGRPRFFRRFAAGVFDVEDLHHRTHELADFVERAAQHYGFDRQRVIAVGYSNGANIAASMLLLRPQALAAAVLFHPMVPFVPEEPPFLVGKAVFIGAGRADTLVPAAQTEQLVAILQAAGADVTVAWHAGGHELSAAEVRAAVEWLRHNQE